MCIKLIKKLFYYTRSRFQITNTLYLWVRMVAETETYVVAIERIKNYVDAEQEAPWNMAEDKNLPSNWPSRGEIMFENFLARYQENTEPVLKGISFRVNSGEKVGVVGRTGAGKSSLMLSLFRIIESGGGRILIDGIDVARIGLHTLRSRLTIIPQVRYAVESELALGWISDVLCVLI